MGVFFIGSYHIPTTLDRVKWSFIVRCHNKIEGSTISTIVITGPIESLHMRTHSANGERVRPEGGWVSGLSFYRAHSPDIQEKDGW